MAHLGDLAISPNFLWSNILFTLKTTPSISKGIFSLVESISSKYMRHSSMDPANLFKLLTGSPQEENTENISCKSTNSFP